MLVLIGDVIALWLMLCLFLRFQLAGLDQKVAWLHMWPLLVLFLVFYCICGLYPGISVGPVEDIKHVVTANLCVFLFVLLVLMFDGAALRSEFLWLIACTCAAVLSTTFRSVVRRIGSRFNWWGYSVVLFGCGNVAKSVLRKLQSQPYLGLRPVAVVADGVAEQLIEGVAVFGLEHLDKIQSSGVKHAIVAAPELSEPEFAEVLERGCDAFPHVIIIPDTNLVWKLGSHTRDLVGVLGLHVGNNLLCPESRVAKRAIDLGLCVLLAPLLLLIMAIIAVLITAEAGFPILYSQKRVGYDGRVFEIWKFRTMAPNASELLQDALVSNPELRREWIENHKLRKDPRITAVGRVLRRTSLDELPQLWNVLKGEMSLVGPRPIVHEEIAMYKEAYSWYTKTTPGVTGMWQVSGRSRTSYAERVAYDTYYVRNWSVWMDIYLLAKTVGVVLTGDGAC